MSKQSKQGIENDAVDGDTILLLNDQSIRARNFADSADVEILKLNASDVPEFQTMPEFAGSPLATQDDIDTDFSSKTTDDLSEGAANFYFTSGRFDSAFSGKDTGDLAEGSDLYYTSGRFDSAFSGKSTSDLTEGTNLYYTSGRFDSDFAAKDTDDLSEGASNFYYTEGRFDSSFSGKSTSDLSEGTNLYYTDARVIAAPITGYVSGAGVVAATDSILQAIQKLNGNIAAVSGSTVTSVNGVSPVMGDVTIDTDDVGEGSTNLYYTAARFNSAFAGKSTSDLAEGTNLYYTTARFNSAFAGKSTSDLSEGSNLYFTDGRAQTAVVVDSIADADTTHAPSRNAVFDALALKQNAATAVTSVNGVSPVAGDVTLTTSDVAEGTNLYYTAARFNTAFAAKSTTDLAEGSNLYYTNARGIGSVLTGYVSGAGAVAASDTILQAVQKLNGNTALKQDAATAVTSVNSVTPTVGNVVLTTTNVAEGSNLYSTTARTLAALVFSQAVPTGTPNGVLVNFTLPFSPHSDQAMIVFVDAVPKVYTTEWSRSGTTLTFVVAPAAGQQVYVWMLRA